MIVNRGGRDWYWPDYDKKLLQVFDWVSDCDEAIKLCKRKETVFQAGGATGVWPVYLSKHFKAVVTLEPEPENYRCLVDNIEGITNIAHFNAAVGEKIGRCSLVNDESERNNCGTWYVTDGNSTDVMTIDSLVWDKCDLICLDVEGDELAALRGAVETITSHRPVIMLEDKHLPYRHNTPGKASEWLSQFGYRVVAKAHRDVILATESHI